MPWRPLIVLIVSQIFGTVGATAGYTVGALAAAAVAGSAGAAGMAQSLASVGTVVASVILARTTDRFGRRTGLSLGYSIAAVGAAVCVTALAAHSFLLLTVGGVLVSAASVTNFQARFAAADLTDGEATKAISLVVWVSTIGSVAGPNLSVFGDRVGDLLSVSGWAGVYTIGGVGFALAALVLFALLRPDPLLAARARAVRADPAPPEGDRERGRGGHIRGAAAAIARSRRAMFALSSVVAGHTIMLAIMTWTPVHMGHGVHGLGAIGMVLSGHFLGMFAFSPLFGWTADRFGRAPVATASALLMLVAVATTGTAGPDSTGRLAAGLFLIGFAWCGMFVVGSGLLTDAVDPLVRPAVQGLTDTAMWICSAIAVGAAGWIVQVGGFGWLAATSALLVVPVLVLGAAAKSETSGDAS